MTFVQERRRFLGAAMGALGATFGTQGSAATDPGAVSPASIQSALGRLDELVANVRASTGVPGLAVAVVQGPNKLYSKGFGVRNIRTREPVDADTVFQLASMSKSVGATAVAREVGLGHVAWNQPMREVLPWFELSDPNASRLVTIGDLYAHRSGLPDHIGDRLEDMGYGQRQVLERLRRVALEGFRTRYAYTNFGLTAAGVGVAEAAGVDWATLSEQAIFRPLGMSRTSSRFDDFLKHDNRVSAHQRVNGEWVLNSTRMPDAQAPAASVTSSVNDLAKWLSMLLGDGALGGQRVVDAAALAAALSPQIESVPASGGRSASFYGYGFNVGVTSAGRRTMGHSGAFALGAATAFKMVPSTGLAMVVLTNGNPIGVPEILCAQFFDLVEYGAIQRDYWALSEPFFAALNAPEGSLVGVSRPTAPVPAQSLAAYAGTYRNDYHGPVQVAVTGDALLMTIGPAPLKLPLTHWDGNVFTFTLDNENAFPGTISKAIFAEDRVTLEYYDKEGMGTFVR